MFHDFHVSERKFLNLLYFVDHVGHRPLRLLESLDRSCQGFAKSRVSAVISSAESCSSNQDMFIRNCRSHGDSARQKEIDQSRT